MHKILPGTRTCVERLAFIPERCTDPVTIAAQIRLFLLVPSCVTSADHVWSRHLCAEGHTLVQQVCKQRGLPLVFTLIGDPP